MTDFVLFLYSTIRSFSQTASSDEDAEEWRPPKPKSKAPNKTARGTATGEKKTTAKKTAKPKEPKAPKVPKEPKLRAPRKPAAGRKTQAAKSLKDSEASVLTGMERKKVEKTGGIQTDCPEETRAEESGTSVRTKEEVRQIFSVYNYSQMKHIRI